MNVILNYFACTAGAFTGVFVGRWAANLSEKRKMKRAMDDFMKKVKEYCGEDDDDAGTIETH